MAIDTHDAERISAIADLDVVRLSQLIRSAVEITKPPPGERTEESRPGAAENVVFDIDVDGDRYILIRTVAAERRAHSLSPREREIVRMVALGHQNKVIAAVLNISSWTVCTHVRRIFTKLGVTSRAAMVAKAAEFGLTIAPYCDADWIALSRGGSSRAKVSAGVSARSPESPKLAPKKAVPAVR